MNETRSTWCWLFFAQLTLVVFASVAATSGHFPTVLFRPPIDKLGHFFAYGLLAFFGVAFFGSARSRNVVVALLLLASTLEELSQRAFPTRTFDLGDIAMNIAGICLFAALAPMRSPLVAELSRTRD